MGLRYQYQQQGFVSIKGLFSELECDQIIEHALAMHARRSIPGCFSSDPQSDDPLQQYPRMMHPHRVEDLSLQTLKHPKIVEVIGKLLGQEAVGLQTMIYWKPPHARGQALHQDDFYLQTQPGACIAAWIALEKIDAENGGLTVCPGSQVEPILEMTSTDTSLSFTDSAVQPNPIYDHQLVEMGKGETLFFHGRLIHGSKPNVSSDRFRKTFICHYIPRLSTDYNKGYDPQVELK